MRKLIYLVCGLFLFFGLAVAQTVDPVAQARLTLVADEALLAQQIAAQNLAQATLWNCELANLQSQIKGIVPSTCSVTAQQVSDALTQVQNTGVTVATDLFNLDSAEQLSVGGVLSLEGSLINSLQNQANTAASRVATLTSQVATLQGQVATLQGQVATQTTRINSLCTKFRIC